VITYRLQVTQAGPSAATGVSVVDRLDPSVDLVSWDIDQGVCTEVGDRLHCDVGDMGPGSTLSLKVRVTPTVPGTITNRGEVTAIETDPNPEDDASNFETKVSAPKLESRAFRASQDATLAKKAPGRRLGRKETLEADKSPEKRFLVKFNVKALPGKKIFAATLRLRSVGHSPFGGSVHAMTDSSWSERTVNWRNAPSIASSAVSTVGAVVENEWYEIDVTDLIIGEGAVSFAVMSRNSDGADYLSRNAGKRYAPQLVVTVLGN
jgi:uncharacterized repeat protein (TIGR01451 family)